MGQKSYSKTKPIAFEEFAPLLAWWGFPENNYAARVETDVAWRIPVSALKRGFDLDVKNPKRTEEEQNLSAEEAIGRLEASFEKSRNLIGELKKQLG